MKNNYKCRDCEQTRLISSKEAELGTFMSGRVKCLSCGGTMDPTPSEVKRLDTTYLANARRSRYGCRSSRTYDS